MMSLSTTTSVPPPPLNTPPPSAVPPIPPVPAASASAWLSAITSSLSVSFAGVVGTPPPRAGPGGRRGMTKARGDAADRDRVARPGGGKHARAPDVADDRSRRAGAGDRQVLADGQLPAGHAVRPRRHHDR